MCEKLYVGFMQTIYHFFILGIWAPKDFGIELLRNPPVNTE